MSRLPPPEQWVLSRMNEIECSEMIEHYIDFVDADGFSVHLPTSFVRHYLQRTDGALPTVVAIATSPIVLGDGELLMPDGLDRQRGIVFVIPEEVRAIMPERADCTEETVREAMQFLTDEWLCDVATDFAGKCTIIAAALTLIERSVLPDRPCFFITAGKRGNGKTTTLKMLIMASLGYQATASAWASNEDERRKALLSYFLQAVPYILWDNIAKGTQISCPHIELSCTSAFFADRKLGASEMVRTAAATIHLFTGNNIGPKGDLASRSLIVRLDAGMLANPENRAFKHPDPIGWTEENRAEIVHALYTLLLGNPILDEPRNTPGKTRFKYWWRMVGSAIEHAAQGEDIDFGTMFIEQEQDDEESASLADALAALRAQWPGDFRAKQVAELINDEG